MSEVDAQYQAIAKNFGEDPKKMDVAQWLGGITTFMRSLVRAKEENIQKENYLAAAAKREREKQPTPKPELNKLVREAAQRGILDELENTFATGLQRSHPS
jgi:hypothetical protein